MLEQTAIFGPFFAMMLRFYLYLVSTLTVWFLIARAALAYLGD